MVGKILLSLLIGVAVGGIAYVVMGLVRRDGSDTAPEKNRGGGGGSKEQKKKRPTDKDDDNFGGRSSDSGLTPTKEWVGGGRG